MPHLKGDVIVKKSAYQPLEYKPVQLLESRIRKSSEDVLCVTWLGTRERAATDSQRDRDGTKQEMGLDDFNHAISNGSFKINMCKAHNSSVTTNSGHLPSLTPPYARSSQRRLTAEKQSQSRSGSGGGVEAAECSGATRARHNVHAILVHTRRPRNEASHAENSTAHNTRCHVHQGSAIWATKERGRKEKARAEGKD